LGGAVAMPIFVCDSGAPAKDFCFAMFLTSFPAMPGNKAAGRQKGLVNVINPTVEARFKNLRSSHDLNFRDLQ
jgi:hypothetical protein